MRSVWLVALLVSAMLAGCTDDGGTNGTAPGQGDGDEAGSGMETVERLRALATAASNDSVTFTKSGATPETANCVQGCGWLYYPLTEHMEPDTAYFLEATLTWTWENNYQGSPNMALVGDAGIRDYSGAESDFDAATITLSATLLGKGDWPVDLRIGGGLDAPDHAVDVTLTPVVDAIPQYAPAAVTVPAGGGLIVETQSGDGRVAVYDADDELLELVEIVAPEGNIPGNKIYSTTVVNSAAEETEFVLFTLDDIWAKVYVLQEATLGPPVLRHLALTVDYEDLGMVDAAGDQTFTFPVEKVPLNIGYRYGSEDCNLPGDPDSCYTTSRAEHSMTDPSGNEILSGSNQGFCYCGGYQSFSRSYDDMPHAQGDYTIQWTSAESSNVQVQGFTWFYVR